jgi:predicted house-cleaning NTP pyrophosphatase (Maf/HAM1 superfamily)
VTAYPILANPGYALRSLVSTTLLRFADSPVEVLKAYAATGEGLDKAGGFALQGQGMPLVKSIEGEWGNVVGFGASAFLSCVEPGLALSFAGLQHLLTVDSPFRSWMGGLLEDEAEDLLEL